MKITWIGGWSFAAERIKSFAEEKFPGEEHVVVYPGEKWSDHLPSQSDIYIGYSLGAFLMLLNPELFLKSAKKILFAPFIDYKKEADMGGRISVTQLKYLIRMLKKDPLGSVKQFQIDAGLSNGISELPYSLDDLIWGIQQLINQSVNLPLNDEFLAYIGENDPLLDHTVIAKCIKTTNVIQHSGHKLEDLAANVEL